MVVSQSLSEQGFPCHGTISSLLNIKAIVPAFVSAESASSYGQGRPPTKSSTPYAVGGFMLDDKIIVRASTVTMRT